MKFCPRCGASRSEGAHFCMNCGFCFDTLTLTQNAVSGSAQSRPVPVRAAPAPGQAAPSVRLNPRAVETASSTLTVFPRTADSDVTASTVCALGWSSAPQPAVQADRLDELPRMSPRLWNGLLFGSIGLAVLALIAAVVFYYQNLTI